MTGPAVSGKAIVAGVAGWPVAHSRSPRLHGHWLKRYGIDGLYAPFAIAPDDFGRAARGLAAAGLAGLNVTLPHKEAAFALSGRTDETARRLGAVNTLIFRPDGEIEGRNTDAFGFAENLKDGGLAGGGGTAVVLGAGGAARAVVLALQTLGYGPIRVSNRTAERTAALVDALTGAPGPGIEAVAWAERAAALAGAALLVNATSLGMAGQPALDLPLDDLPAGAAVTDIVYTPLETPLLAAARSRGCRTVDGLGMLLHQGRPGFHAWFGVDPAVDADLRRAVAGDLLAGDLPAGGMMRIVGLTGSIGMGKSAAAGYLRFLGVPVYDADAAVHAVYARGGAAVGPVGAVWPEAVRDGAIDRDALSALIAADRAVLPRLESIVHPIVRQRQERFLLAAALRRAPAIALDIPLLFETGGERRCDAVLVVSAPGFVQRARVLARPEMTAEKLALIVGRQMPDAEKCARADFVIPSHRGWRAMLDSLRRAIRRTLEVRRRATGRPTRRWPRRGRSESCVKSCSIPKPPASIRPPATGSSRSAPSSCSIICRPAGNTTPIWTRNARCRRTPSPSTACPTISSPAGTGSPMSPTPFWNSSATRRWSSTTPPSTSSSSTTN